VDPRHPEETCADVTPAVRASRGCRRNRDAGDRVHFELDAREHIVVRAGCLVGRGFRDLDLW